MKTGAAVLYQPKTPMVIEELDLADPHEGEVNASNQDPVGLIHELTGGGVDYAFEALAAGEVARSVIVF